MIKALVETCQNQSKRDPEPCRGDRPIKGEKTENPQFWYFVYASVFCIFEGLQSEIWGQDCFQSLNSIIEGMVLRD